jgi:small subunit ribosomal protein S17
MYKKFVTKSKKYAAHDEKNLYKVGDSVTIQETKPISKSKTWEVVYETASK